MARRRGGVTKQQIAEAFGVGKREQKKVRKKRKPMTEEQKAAARERLAKAREARAAKAEAEGKVKKLTYHPVCYEKPEENVFYLKNVLEWLKYAKEQRSSFQSRMRNTKGMKPKDMQHISDRYHWWHGYVNDINHYLKHGDWISNFYGKDQQNKTKWNIVASAENSILRQNDEPEMKFTKTDTGQVKMTRKRRITKKTTKGK